MKRLFLLATIVASFTLSACHKDNDTHQPNDKRLIKALDVEYINNGYFTEGRINNDPANGYSGSSDIEWNDSLVTSINGLPVVYVADTIYVGGENYIMAIKKDGRIHKIIRNRNPSELWFTYTFTYNNSGEIVSLETMCRDCVPMTTTFTWQNGNLIESHETWYDGNWPPRKHETIREYTYDNMHTPYECMEDICLIMNPSRPPSRNNILTSRSITIESEGTLTEPVTDTSELYHTGTLTYSNGYPIIWKYIDEPTHVSKTYYVYADGTSANIPQICNITATANRSTVAGYYARGGGQYEYGTTVLLYAFERDFIRWDDGNTDNPRTVIARGDATYTAIYTDK